MTDDPADDENSASDGDAQFGPTTMTTPGVKPAGSLHDLIAERDEMRERLDEALHLLTGVNDQVVAFELRMETGDPHRELMTALNEEKQRVRQLEERIRGLMTEKNEAIRAARYWKKKVTEKIGGFSPRQPRDRRALELPR